MKHNGHSLFHKLNILLFVCAMVCLVCYDIFGTLWLKGFTSSWFVLLGTVNLVYARVLQARDWRFPLLIWLGLVLGACADVLLGVRFLLGILAFALGHVCYLIGFFLLEKPCKRDIFWIGPIALVSVFLVTGTPYIQIHDPMLKKLLTGYALIIAAMLGKAISNRVARKSASRSLLALGSMLFWFSDLILAIDLFGTGSRLTWILCSYAYWPAQCILAYAIFRHLREDATGT